MHSLTLYIVCGLFLCQHTTAQWAPYPACVQQLQLNNGPADCNFGWSTQEEVDQSNACLCPNEGYESETARTIYTNCGCNDLITSASLIVTACEISGTVSFYDEAQIISAGDGGQSVCQNINTSSAATVVAKSTVTITEPAAPTSSNGGSCDGNNNGSGTGDGNCNTININTSKGSANGLSSPAKIATGVTVPIVVLALISFLWYIVRKHRQRRRLIFESQSREVPNELDNRNIVYQKEQWDIKPQLGANEAQWPDV